MTDAIKQLMQNIEKNQMQAFYCETAADAVEQVRALLKEGDVISCGGSVTLAQSGVLELMRSGAYTFLDRSKAETPEAVEEIYRRTFSADVYLTSCNAITEQGWLYNVDGNSNRIAAIAFGPKSVIAVVGVNKIVKDLKAAERRVKEIAAPKNTIRLEKDTYCAKTGECVSLQKADGQMCDGCACEARICANFLVSARQRQKNRIKVILVNQALGY
ncbi:MAG: lactate utilization protein [Clostridia bacterium]|nr:lactate utilization protein [Clostridia bacterium]